MLGVHFGSLILLQHDQSVGMFVSAGADIPDLMSNDTFSGTLDRLDETGALHDRRSSPVASPSCSPLHLSANLQGLPDMHPGLPLLPCLQPSSPSLIPP
jgi:hypothetical protein